MHRLTARLLLILLLVGSFAPAALAISAPTPHACCMRKPMHMGATHGSEFHAPASCCQHDCCRALTVSQWAQLTLSTNTDRASASTALQLDWRAILVCSPLTSTHSGRAPPQLSIA